jgi:SAM-dependent methyltransferase
MGMWYHARQSLARTLRLKVEHSQQRYFRALQQSVGVGRYWLDVGCGRQLVPEWAASLSGQQELAARAFLVGVDIDSGLHENRLVHQKVVGIGEQLPFRDSAFDLVTANMVMEHLEDPEKTLAEIWRVFASRWNVAVPYTKTSVPPGARGELGSRLDEGPYRVPARRLPREGCLRNALSLQHQSGNPRARSVHELPGDVDRRRRIGGRLAETGTTRDSRGVLLEAAFPAGVVALERDHHRRPDECGFGPEPQGHNLRSNRQTNERIP